MKDNKLAPDDDPLAVVKCEDFELNGKGDHAQWNKASWTTMPFAGEQKNAYETRFKILYSETGIYVLGHCEDKLISTDYTTDQGDIWNGDVFEVFLQTDEDNPLYFEYEINPLNAELVILVPNNEGDFFGWAPWHYDGNRKVKKAVNIQGGAAQSGEKINAWTIEVFFPYALFKALKNVPPKPGMEWKGNFYRMDYDTGERLSWSWKPVETTFHEYKKFGRLLFK
jgi:hypothetical protein